MLIITCQNTQYLLLSSHLLCDAITRCHDFQICFIFSCLFVTVTKYGDIDGDNTMKDRLTKPKVISSDFFSVAPPPSVLRQSRDACP